MQWNTQHQILIVSTYFMSVICNTVNKTFCEIRGNFKNGKFGACVINQDILEAKQGNKLCKTDFLGNFKTTLCLLPLPLKNSRKENRELAICFIV